MSATAYQNKASPLTRRMIGFLLMGMTPIVGLGIWLIANIVSSENEELRRVSQMVAQHNIEVLDRFLFERGGDAQILADLPVLRKDPVQISARLDSFVTTYAPFYALILVVDRQGRIEAVNRIDANGQPIASSALIGRSVRGEPWFERALQAGPSVSIEDIHQDPLLAQVYGEPRLALSLSAPIRDDTGTVIRVVSSRILLATLAESLVLTGHGYKSLAQSPVSLTLVTREGMELATTGMSADLNKTPLQLLRHVSSEIPLATVTSAGFSTYPGLGWRIIAYPSKGKSRHPELLWGSVGLVVILSVAVGMITVFLYRYLLAPIKALNQEISRIARREPIDLESVRMRDDELGSLARTVEQMAHGLIEHQQRLESLCTICMSLQQIQTIELSASNRDAFLLEVLTHAVELIGARYGALGVFDETGKQLAQFLTVGLDEATRAAIGAPPAGKGLLGLLRHEDKPIRLKDLMAHPSAVGFPPQHPPMHSFLGQSIKIEHRLYGRIYLTEKIGAEEFSETDAQVLGILAIQVSIAIESGRHLAALRTTEAALRANQRQLQAILDHTSAVVFVKDLQGRYLLVNRRYETLFHVTQETLKGKTDYDLFPAPMAQAFQDADAKALAAHAPISVDELVPQDDGLHTYISVKFPLYDDAGQPYGVCGIATDITDRKQMENVFHALVEGTAGVVGEMFFPVLVQQLATALGVSYVMIGEFAGQARDRVRTLAVWGGTEILENFEYPLAGMPCEQLLDTTQWHYPQDLRTQFPAVKLFADLNVESYLGISLRDASGQALGVLAVMDTAPMPDQAFSLALLNVFAARATAELRRLQAVTALHKTQQQLQQAQKMEAIGRLAGGIAHDFNNVLTVIAGNTRFLREELPPDHPGHGLVAEIAEAGDRAAQLTAQLLAFSRKQRVQPQRLDLSQTLPTIERLLRRLIGEDVTVTLVPGPPGSLIVADPTQLEQVLLNLAINARDAMLQGGRVTIEVGPVDIQDGEPCSHGTLAPGAYVRLRVTDTGMGMTADTLAQCFEPFFTTKAQGQGTGLGLATVYGIVAEHHGVIDVTSRPAQGTCFTLYFPRAHGTAAGADEAPVQPASRKGSETVLLVEDDRAVRTWVKKVLTRAGYRVIEAANGAQALQCCRDAGGPVPLLLTDMVMPELSGPEVAAQLTRAIPSLRVLYMSGYSDHPVFKTGSAARALLQKPFTPEQLLETIRAVLDAPPS